MNVELRHLRAFVAVAENLSYTAASRVLLITQPALTRTIQQLEQSLEVTLLERTSRSVTVTNTGRTFLVRAQTILRDVDLAIASTQGERILRIGFSWGLPDPWTSNVIEAFEETTGATARLMRRDDLASALERNEIDVALARQELLLPAATSMTLVEEARVAAISSRSELAMAERLTWDELAKHPVIINTTSGSTAPEQWSTDQRPSEIVECDNYDEWIALIAADRGVGATGHSAATTSTHTGVAFIPLVGAPPVQLRLTWLPDRSGVLVRRFLQTATDIARPR